MMEETAANILIYEFFVYSPLLMEKIQPPNFSKKVQKQHFAQKNKAVRHWKSIFQSFSGVKRAEKFLKFVKNAQS